MNKDKKELTRKCPLCLGEGILHHRKASEYTHYKPEIREKARELHRKGLSYRQIGKEIGVKGAQKVKSLIIAKTL